MPLSPKAFAKVCAPRDAKLGILSCVTTQGGENRLYGRADLALAEELGRRLSCAMEIDRLTQMIQTQKPRDA